MTKHCKIYLKYFDYGTDDHIPCELCGRPANDLHHIKGRGRGMDIIENIIALCRNHHNMAHAEEISKSEMQYIHNSFMLGNRKRFMK